MLLVGLIIFIFGFAAGGMLTIFIPSLKTIESGELVEVGFDDGRPYFVAKFRSIEDVLNSKYITLKVVRQNDSR